MIQGCVAKRTKDQERRLVVRPLRADDHPAIVDIHRRCFPDLKSWSKQQFQKHLKQFPEGQLGIELDGKLVATSTSLIVEESDYGERHTFAQVSEGGDLRQHDPEGDSLYGLDIAVDPEFRGMRLSRRLYEARKRLVRELNLRRIVIGGRMPRYHRYAGELTPDQYVQKVVAKEIRDPVITAQLSNGFVVKSVLEGYLPNDQGSQGFAVYMEWHNPDYRPKGRRRASKVRVASVQYSMRTLESFEQFATQCEFFIDTASEYRVDFLLFPELITNQLQALVPAERPAETARRLHEFTPQYEEFFGQMAIRYYVNIIAGSHLVVENGELFNVSYLFHRDGRVDRQYKIHVTPAEARWWGVSAGYEVLAFDTDRCKIGIAICYDSEFPELARHLREQGAQILFVPYNTDLRSGHVRVRTCTQARCIENHMYAVTSGACGNLPMVEGADIHYAQCAILTPSDVHFARDAVAAEATPNVEQMLIHDLDLDTLRRTERTGTVRPWIDRRTDLYEVKWIGKKPRRGAGATRKRSAKVASAHEK